VKESLKKIIKMGSFQTEAIIIKQFDLGESDKIITCYTKDYGKIRAVARGVRMSKSPISGTVLPFNYNYMVFYQGRSMPRINQVKNIYSFTELRENLKKMAYASYMAEFVEKVGLENAPNQALFSLLLSNFYQLLKAGNDELKYIDLIFNIKVLAILGIKPELEHCVICNRELNYYQQNIFNIEHGGLECQDCYKEHRDETDIYRYFVLGETIQIIKKILGNGIQPLLNIKISDRACQEIEQLIRNFTIFHLDIKLNSCEFLNMIKKLG
jgi:DNA repair protein RecO (recombination protein O)